MVDTIKIKCSTPAQPNDIELKVPPVQPLIQPVVPLVQPIIPPVQPAIPEAGPVLLLNWSQFKPGFMGKPDEDAEAYLLWKNDWMDICAFPEGVKFQIFCLTSVGEARLWN